MSSRQASNRNPDPGRRRPLTRRGWNDGVAKFQLVPWHLNQPVDRKHERWLAAFPYQYAIHAAELLVLVVADIGPDEFTDLDVTRDPPERDSRLEGEVPLVTVVVAYG